MRNAGPAASAVIAIGVASAVSNVGRRDAARQTWMRHTSVGQAVHVHFILRVPRTAKMSCAGVELSCAAISQRLRRIHVERLAHRDILLARVHPGLLDDLHGRVLTLHTWLRRAVAIFSRAVWICKADDDAYVVIPSYEQQLLIMGRKLSVQNRSIVHGWLGWSAWHPRSYLCVPTYLCLTFLSRLLSFHAPSLTSSRRDMCGPLCLRG